LSLVTGTPAYDFWYIPLAIKTTCLLADI